MKKFLCAILFLTMVISLSACGGKGVSTLVKHYGQEKVDEMEIECTDETQLKVANDLIAEAKDIMSYCGSGDGTNKEDCFGRSPFRAVLAVCSFVSPDAPIRQGHGCIVPQRLPPPDRSP